MPPIYHFTDFDNLEPILEAWALQCPPCCSASNPATSRVSSNQRRLLYFVSSTEAAYGADLDCVFTDGNAAMSITEFDDDPANLATLVDWEVMELTYWNNTDEDPDRRRRRMAEFLIHDSVPLELFTEIGVTDAEVQEAVGSAVVEAGWDVPVSRRSDWYF